VILEGIFHKVGAPVDVKTPNPGGSDQGNLLILWMNCEIIGPIWALESWFHGWNWSDKEFLEWPGPTGIHGAESMVRQQSFRAILFSFWIPELRYKD
jgi:hypothetical protein